jgi:zinc protease
MRRSPLLLALLSLAALALLVPGPALAKKKKKKGKKGAEPTEEVTPEEKPPSMFELVSTTDFIGDLKVERYTLSSNGLTVFLVRDPSSDTVAYHTYFDVGSGDEVVGKTGLAHLFEHMMFKRTDKYDDQHFSRTIEEAGGPDLNAWTWLDMTAYHVSLPKAKLPLIVELESTRMDGLIIDEGQLDSERDVVLNERRFRVDNSPDGAVNERLWALAFEETRYHWPTIGWEDDIKGYTVEDCTSFYRDYYAPNNATIVLVGGFDTDEALRLLEAGYGPIPASDLKRLDHGEDEPQMEARRLDLELEVQSERIQVGYKVPGVGHADRPAIELLHAILTEGSSARLQRRFVDTGWAASASGWMPPFQHESLYEFSVTMREGKAAGAALAILGAELTALKEAPVPAEELERARAQLLASSYEQLLSNSGRAGFIGFNQVAQGDWTRGLDAIEAIRTVTAEDVLRVARAYFVDESSSIVTARPNGKSLLKHRSRDLPEIPTEAVELAKVIDRPGEGAAPYEVGKVMERESMGWTRLMVYDDALPMVWFRIVLPYGSGVETEEQRGLANVTAELLLRGTEDRDRDSFERTLEGLGAGVDAWVGHDSITISGSTLSENWPKVASLLSEAFEFPAFDEGDFDDLIDEIQADIVESRNSDRGLARRFFAEGLFAEHEYALPVEGTIASLDKLKIEDVSIFYRTWFTSQGAILALLGDFDAGAGGDLAKLAGKLEGTPLEREPSFEPPGPMGRTVWLVDKPERTQTQILLGHLFARPEGELYAAAWLANEAFGGGGFGARLMHQVREIRGWSYGAYAWPRHFKQLSTYSMWVFPANADTMPTIDLVLELYEQLVAEGITEDELAYGRGSIVNSSAFYKDTPSKRLTYEVRKRMTGYDPAALIPTVAMASLEQVNDAASVAFTPDDMFIAILGTADSKITLGEGDEARELTLLEALQERFGEESVTVVPFDRD